MWSIRIYPYHLASTTEVQNTVSTDSLLRCRTHHPYDERDSFLLQLLFQHRLLIWYGRPSPVSDHPFSSASNLLFIAVAMVVSWSRRVLFLFSLLCYRYRSWVSAALSVDLFDFLFLAKNASTWSENHIFTYNLSSLMYCMFWFCKYFGEYIESRAHVFLYVCPFHELI